MRAWLIDIVQFVPICMVVSLVCAAMKEDDLACVARRGVRIFGTLAALTVGFSLVIYGVILAFL